MVVMNNIYVYLHSHFFNAQTTHGRAIGLSLGLKVVKTTLNFVYIWKLGYLQSLYAL